MEDDERALYGTGKKGKKEKKTLGGKHVADKEWRMEIGEVESKVYKCRQMGTR